MKWLFCASVSLLLATGPASGQGLNLLGVDADDPVNPSWRIACAWTARDKNYRGLEVGECVVTEATHLPDQTDHWVEFDKTWAFCVTWMNAAGVPGW